MQPQRPEGIESSWCSGEPSLPAPAARPCASSCRVRGGPDWLHEIKWDGYRIVARRHGNLIRVWSRYGRSWTEAFPAITNAIRALPTDSVIIDGEAVCLREDRSSDFNTLRSQRTCKTARLMAFDLLYIGGQDLRGFPLEERRAMLAALLKDEPYDGLWLSGEVGGSQGEALFRQACMMNLEGIVSKRKGRPYLSGPSPDWIKVRCPEYRRV
jgi:bifunctional non-homologous end joining protein LigD